MVKISLSPVGLSTPGPLVRSLEKTIRPFLPGKAASAGALPGPSSDPVRRRAVASVRGASVLNRLDGEMRDIG
jgi:hypothetical protein